MDLILEATKKNGGVYLYANQQGCDGDRLYYDGCAMIVINGEIVAQGSQFSLNDVEVVTATVDLAEVRSYRYPPSRRQQAAKAPVYQRIPLEVELGDNGDELDPTIQPSPSLTPRYHVPEEEIALGPACWMWDYVRRSRQAGYFVPLSGGIDSCATATIVFSMCREVCKALEQGNEQVKEDMLRMCDEKEDSTWIPKTPQELCGRLFCSCFMGTDNSSKETRKYVK
jgi:NAD+ synthase (glutamine-hydrolysing)